MAKKITLEVVDKAQFNRVLVKVDYQSHVGSSFGNWYGGKKFTASNGLTLGSNSHPSKDESDKLTIWLQGTGEFSKQSNCIAITRAVFDKLVVAVKEYNFYYSDAEIWKRNMAEVAAARYTTTASAPVNNGCTYFVG